MCTEDESLSLTESDVFIEAVHQLQEGNEHVGIDQRWSVPVFCSGLLVFCQTHKDTYNTRDVCKVDWVSTNPEGSKVVALPSPSSVGVHTVQQTSTHSQGWWFSTKKYGVLSTAFRDTTHARSPRISAKAPNTPTSSSFITLLKPCATQYFTDTHTDFCVLLESFRPNTKTGNERPKLD